MPRLLRRAFVFETFVLLLVTTLFASPLPAQESAESQVGARVRVALPSQMSDPARSRHAQMLTGTLARATTDSLHIDLGPGADTLRVARTAILNLSVSRGVSRRRSAVRQALYGALTFAATGMLCESAREQFTDSRANWRTALFGAGIGLLSGATVGALYPDEEWRRIGR